MDSFTICDMKIVKTFVNTRGIFEVDYVFDLKTKNRYFLQITEIRRKNRHLDSLDVVFPVFLFRLHGPYTAQCTGNCLTTIKIKCQLLVM